MPSDDSDHTTPLDEEVLSYLRNFSNWERWGADDEAGTLSRSHIPIEPKGGVPTL